MNMRYVHVIFVTVLLSLASITQAAKISYTATDISDTTTGEDLWQYAYSVSDHIFTADTGFTIYFELGLYDLLDPSPTAPNGDWDVLTWNPDPALPGDGAYDAYALVDNASLANLFIIDFVWLGGSSGPGSQDFDVYDAITWSVLDSGTTTLASTTTPSAVPLPPALWLFGFGLSMIYGKKRLLVKLN